MAANYLPYEPQQMLLQPEAIQDWLPEGHLAHFISDTVDTLDLSAFHARYDRDGPRNQPFHPAMMVKVLVYGYATGLFSSRRSPRSCTRTWPSGCWLRATSPRTARSATSERCI
jgi:transposase